MKAKIVGIARRKGISKKSGEAYDNANVFVTYKEFGTQGLSTAKLFIKAADFDLDRLSVGQECEFDRNEAGFLCGFDLIPNK